MGLIHGFNLMGLIHESMQIQQKHTNYPFEVHGGLEDYEHARNMSEIKQKFNEPVDECS